VELEVPPGHCEVDDAAPSGSVLVTYQPVGSVLVVVTGEPVDIVVVYRTCLPKAVFFVTVDVVAPMV